MGQRVLNDVQSIQTLLRADQHHLKASRRKIIRRQHVKYAAGFFSSQRIRVIASETSSCHMSSCYLVSERQSAIDVQTVVTLQLEQRVAQKFLLGQQIGKETYGAEEGSRLGRSQSDKDFRARQADPRG